MDQAVAHAPPRITPTHAAHDAEGQQHPIKIYLWIWLLLFVFSAFSYMVDYFQLQGYLRWTLIIIFMLLKAGFIVAIFMHMAWERLALKLAILTAAAGAAGPDRADGDRRRLHVPDPARFVRALTRIGAQTMLDLHDHPADNPHSRSVGMCGRCSAVFASIYDPSPDSVAAPMRAPRGAGPAKFCGRSCRS